MRERMITRTVVTTNYETMVVDTETKTVETIIVSIPSADSLNEKSKEKAIKEAIPTGKVYVQIMSEHNTETLYGMLEADFIKLAKVLPPRATQSDK